MIHEPLPPKNLKEIQYWFASIITRPIDEDNNMNPVSPKGVPMVEEAQKYIMPNEYFNSAQRIEIYNQQYWWRLLSILHDGFPLLVRLFGYHDFNMKIGFPYLAKYIPNHWSLTFLGSRLPYWIKRFYSGNDKKLVSIAADIDLAYNMAFIAPHHPSIQQNDLQNILEKPLFLQPHITLYEFQHPIFEFRNEMISKEPEHWVENDFPQMEKQKKTGYMLWRDSVSNVGWIHIDPIEFTILKQFKQGKTFDALCEWLETQPGKIFNAASNNLQLWTHRWILNEWLYKDDKQEREDLLLDPF